MSKQSNVAGIGGEFTPIIAFRETVEVAAGVSLQNLRFNHNLNFYTPYKLYYQVDNNKTIIKAPTDLRDSTTELDDLTSMIEVQTNSRPTRVTAFLTNNDTSAHDVTVYCFIYLDRSQV